MRASTTTLQVLKVEFDNNVSAARRFADSFTCQADNTGKWGSRVGPNNYVAGLLLVLLKDDVVEVWGAQENLDLIHLDV